MAQVLNSTPKHASAVSKCVQRVSKSVHVFDTSCTALEELDTALPTEKEFYELTQSKLLDLLHEDDIVVLNAICSEFVTNLRAGNDSTPVITLNPPYDLMVDLSKITYGRG